MAVLTNLSTKKKVYNSYSRFSQILGLPFAESSRFWKFVDPQIREVLISSASKSTKDGAVERNELKSRVCGYPLVGPLGSQDPKIPVCEKDILSKLHDPSSNLKESWEKTNIFPCAKNLDKRPHVQAV